MCQADARSAFSADGPGARKVTCIGNLFQATHFHKKGGTKKMEDKAWKKTLSIEEERQICPCCGNIYKVVRTNKNTCQGSFGHIRCLSCGMYTEV